MFCFIFALLLIGVPSLWRALTFQQDPDSERCLARAMSIFTSFLIVATARLIPKDVEDATVYTILSAKPVPRFEYVLGKLAGVLCCLPSARWSSSAMFSWCSTRGEQAMLHQTLSQMSARAARGS